jgi:predicted ATPase
MAAVTTQIDNPEGDHQAPLSNKAVSSIKLSNLLSFGPDNEQLSLLPLNILIGPNAVGKSNLIDAFALLRAAAKNSLADFISTRGGVGQWIWKGEAGSEASIEVVIDPNKARVELPHCDDFINTMRTLLC